MAKSDTQLKHDICEELRWDPKVSSDKIFVHVFEGAVSLSGAVDTYAERLAAEEATKRVSGVRTVCQDLAVELPAGHERIDADILGAVQTALTWNVFVPAGVTAHVKDGWVTLDGQVSWKFQRDAATNASRYLTGVTGVDNHITLKPQASATQVKEKVLAALQRQAIADASSIQVDTLGGKVTLTGHASSWQAIEDAANAAWAAPGVTEVIDQVKREMTLGTP